MRVGNDLVNSSTRISADISQLSSCFVDDWRNFRELFRGQIEFGAKPVFHSSADPLGVMQFKEMIPGICSSNERAGDSTRDKYEEEPRDEFPLQRTVHLKLILDRRVSEGEFIRVRFANFAALICFANCRDCRYDDYGDR